MDMLQSDMSIDLKRLTQEAQVRWLKPVEVFLILQNYENFEITQEPPQKPPSGSLFLFNRRVLRYFRNDGYSWKKKKNGKTVREGHEKLKVGKKETLNCYYAHGEENPCLQRRCYWMLNWAYEHIALVHYREAVEGRHMPDSILSISNDIFPTLTYIASVAKDETQCFNSTTSGFNTAHQSSSSQGSGEVSSKFNGKCAKMSLINGMEKSESCNQLLLPDYFQELRKLEEQLNLDDDEVDTFVSSEKDLLPCCSFNVERQELLVQETRSKHIVEALQTPFTELKQGSNDHLKEDPKSDSWLNNSDAWGCPDESPYQQCFTSEANDSFANCGPILGTDISSLTVRDSVCLSDIWSYPSQFEGPLQTDSSLSVPLLCLFTILEVSPQWSFSSESTKVIITGDFLCNPSECVWAVLFGDIEVSLDIVQHGVFRCMAPQHDPGKVKLFITSGNRKPCSEAYEFEFREKLENTKSSLVSQVAAAKSKEELTLLVNLVQMLLSENSTSNAEDVENKPGLKPLFTLKGSKNQLQTIIESILAGSKSSGVILDAILQELMKDKFQQWLLSHQKADGGLQLSKTEKFIIHLISGLGYQWALHPILNSGTSINYRDSNGWTALHWAAHFGREEMVAMLLAADAFAGARTNPTAQDPEGKTPASLADSNDHKGLAGYLSEAALTSHLFSLTTERAETLEGSSSVEADRGVDNISERKANVQGGTEDQLSIKDSLAAIRNATQAAARIQVAFRAYSFRMKQQSISLLQGKYDIHSTDTHGFSVASRSHKTFLGSHDKKYRTAAVSIQKNYRCWKIRKEFIHLRTNVVKIQAHVRAHLARKKYKDFIWSVGILEKVMLRWYKRGVGLRGYHAEPKFIDEEEEDDINKVFRKQKVSKTLDEALSRVISVIESPEARHQYRRMLENYQQAKAELSQGR